MFRELPSAEKQQPTQYTSDISLRIALSSISLEIVATYFSVVICDPAHIEIELTGFIDRLPANLRFGFYNHKGHTYFKCTSLPYTGSRPIQLRPFSLLVQREWIPEYLIGEVPVDVQQPNGQLNLEQFGCTAFEFCHVSFSNREIAIDAKTNRIPSSRATILVCFYGNLPEIRCFIRETNSGSMWNYVS